MQQYFKYALILCFGAVSLITAQVNLNKFDYQNYKVHDGLAGNTITSITQDKFGYIWIGTRNGLSRFNGVTFTNFFKNQKPLNLKDGYIYSLINLNDSLIAALTPEGASIINIVNLSAQQLIIPDTTGFYKALNNSCDLLLLKNRNYLLLTKSGIYEFNPSGDLIFRKDFLTKDLINLNKNKVIYEFEKKEFAILEGKIAVFAFEKIQFFDPDKHSLYQLDARLKNQQAYSLLKSYKPYNSIQKRVSNTAYFYIDLSKDSLLLINESEKTTKSYSFPTKLLTEIYFTSKPFKLNDSTFALSSYNGGVFTFIIHEHSGLEFINERYLEKSKCHAVFKDKEGRVWIGTNNGLLKQKNYNSYISRQAITDSEFNLSPSTSILEFSNKIFISTKGINNTLYVLDAKSKKILHSIDFLAKNDPNPLPYNLGHCYKDTLWISTYKGIMWLDVNNYSFGSVPLPKELLKVPLRFGDGFDKNGNLWMCGLFESHYVCYNPKNRNFTYYTRETKTHSKQEKPVGVIYDAFGDVWFYGFGLQKWDVKKNTFDTLISDFGKLGNYETFFENVVSDVNGNLWVYLKGYGYIKYDIKKTKASLYCNGEDFPIKNYQTTSGVVNNNIWFGYDDYLINYNIEKNQILTFTEDDGLPEEPFLSRIYYCKSTQECLALAGKNLLSFKNTPADIRKRDIKLDYIDFGGNTVVYNPKDTIYLTYKQKTFTIKFCILDYNIKFQQKLNYQIDNNGNWNTIEQSQPILLYNLSTGWHTINIKSLINPGKFSEKTISIYVKPPFWETTWFLVIVVLTILIATTITILIIIARIKKQKNLVILSKEFEIKALHAQMNPHFIFNCLNSIKALVITNKNSEASKYINGFSRLVRLNLDHSRRTFISLKENIDYIELYLQSEKLRFTDFEYTIEIEEDLDIEHFMVVPMLIQPIVENAIWHGLQSITTQRILKIYYASYENGIKCVIDDNGIGIKKASQLKKSIEKESVGMENIRERIKLFNEKNKLNYKIEVVDKSDIDFSLSGTRVTIYFNSI